MESENFDPLICCSKLKVSFLPTTKRVEEFEEIFSFLINSFLYLSIVSSLIENLEVVLTSIT